MARVRSTKPRLLGLGLIVLGACASLLYRHPSGFSRVAEGEVGESAWPHAEGVSLQVPGQSTPTHLPDAHPAARARRRRCGAGARRGDRGGRRGGSAARPPALADHYLPLFSPPPDAGRRPENRTGARVGAAAPARSPCFPRLDSGTTRFAMVTHSSHLRCGISEMRAARPNY